MHAHVDRIAPALDILADVVMRPTLAADEFERRKQQRLAFLLQQNEEPRNLASQAFTSIVFGEEHPYGRPMLGTRETVGRITRDDVAAFHANYIRPDVAFFVVVGDIDEESVRVMLERAFGAWRAGASADIPAIQAPATRTSRAIHVVDRPASAQSELRIGGLGIDRTSPDFFPVMVMNTVLGGSFTSRLNLNLRQDKGYTYGAGSSFGLRLYTGPFVASTAVDTNVTADAIHQIMLEIDRIRDEVVPADELDRAQNYIALGLPRGFETTSDIANHIAEVELYHLGADYYDKYVERIRAVTAAEVQRVARRYLDTASFAVVLAGDLHATQRSLQELELGPVLKRVQGTQ
jgi:predicted Zn-dependent peptidase